jgi:hypothetical protein
MADVLAHQRGLLPAVAIAAPTSNCAVAVAEGVVQQPLFAADEAFLQDCEDDDDDEQRGESPEEDGDARDQEDRAEVHGVPAPAIEAVANQYGRFCKRPDRRARGLERASRPDDHGSARRQDKRARVREGRPHDDGERHDRVQRDHRDDRDEGDLRR